MKKPGCNKCAETTVQGRAYIPDTIVCIFRRKI